MKLWLLRPRQEGGRYVGPWKASGLGMATAIVLRAESEADARRLATDENEELTGARTGGSYDVEDGWLNPDLSICEELTAEGDAGIIVADVWEP